MLVLFPGGRAPALEILINVDADDLVGGKEPVFDALAQGISIEGVAKIIDIGNIAGFLRGGGHTDLGGGFEVFQHIAPGGIGGGTATVALINDDEIEEIRGELLVDVPLFLGAGDGLIERQVDLVGLVHLAVDDFGHGRLEGLEVVDPGLIHQDIAIGQEKDALLGAGAPQAPDNLEGGIGLAGAGGHDEKDAILPLGNSLHGAIDGDLLVIAGHLARSARVVILGDNSLFGGFQSLCDAITMPEFGRGRKSRHGDLPLHFTLPAGAIMFQKSIAIGAEGKRHIEGLGSGERLLHASTNGMDIVLNLNNGNGNTGLVIEDVIGTPGLPACNLGAPNDHPTGRKGHFFSELRLQIPSSGDESRGDEFRTDVTFRQRFLSYLIIAVASHMREVTPSGK